MEKGSLPFAGGLSAAAILALVLGQLGGATNNLAISPQATPPNLNAPSVASNNAASANVLALSENEQGPWYALCQVFSSVDPEDLESLDDHPLRPPAGIKIHPSLSKNAEARPQQIQEETVTKKTGASESVQWKFAPSYHYQADLTSCLPTTPDLSKLLTLHYMIVTIPDPLGSHLALQFDRNVVAIERAAEAEGFKFERYWFPWDGVANIEQGKKAGASEALRQQLKQQPGILIFREFNKTPRIPSDKSIPNDSNYSSRLVVFLVGETPTSGVNKVSFSKAATYISQLQARLADKEPVLQVLGPNYSGSFSTLYRVIHDLHETEKSLAVNVVSPTATVGPLIKTFTDELKTESLGTFKALSPDDEVTQTLMLNQLEIRGYRPDDIAYLSEDESSYSPGNESGNNQKLFTLTYPRDLSALRNSWTPTSVYLTPADISGEVFRNQMVPFSLHEGSSNDLDSPNGFATDQAAPDIDQALNSLVSIVRHRRFRVLIVTASNPLDEVYLLQYIHKNNPDVRLATYDQDFLMLRETSYDSLRGTLSVTPFPLDSSLLIGKTDTSQFPNSSAEATYIGVRQLLEPQGIKSPIDPGGLASYVLGDDGFWPARQKELIGSFVEQDPIVPWIWYVLTAVLIGFVIFHLLHYARLYLPHSVSSGSRPSKSLATRMGLSGSRREEDLLQDYFLLVGNNQMLILLFFAAVPTATVWSAFVGSRNEWIHFGLKLSLILAELGMLVLMIVLSVLLVLRVRNTIVRVTQCAEQGQKRIVGYGDLCAAVVYSIVTMTVWYLVIHYDGKNAEPAAFRTIYVLDGLSPLLVAGSVVAVWYLFSIMGLRAVRAMKGRRVDPLFLASKELDGRPEWTRSLGIVQGELLNKVESFVSLDRRSKKILAGCFLSLFALQVWPALRGVDVQWFRFWLVFFGVGLLTASIITQFFRIWSVWGKLRTLLAILDLSPLGAGFERIPQDLASVKVWQSWEGRNSHALQSYTLEILRRIMDRSPMDVRKILSPYCEAAEIHVEQLKYKRPWNQETGLNEHMLLNACFDGCVSPAIGEGKDWFLQQCELGDALTIDYAALRYVALIKYVNVQMRSLLSFVLYGYVFLLLGLKTYPFQGQHTISSVLSIVFSILFLFAAAMFIQMDSNPVLSKLERSTPGKTNYFEAAVRLVSVGGIPLIAVLASQFPAIERFLLGWVKPTVESLH